MGHKNKKNFTQSANFFLNPKIHEKIAVLLIYLVLTIPFYTTIVYAEINKVSVKGGDGIEGYAREKDFINFNIQAVISASNGTITSGQVVLGDGIPFDKCSPSINNGSECTLRIPGNGTDFFTTQPFTIKLYNNDKTLDDSKSGILIVDSKPPEIKLSVSKSKFSSQDGIVIDYDAADFACDAPACGGKCAGIKNIEFFNLGGSFKQAIDVKTEECSVKSSISIESKKLAQGQNSIFAKATDKFGQVSPETSVTFEVDTSGPSILSNSFEILRNGISLSAFSPQKVPVDVAVKISGDDLNKDSVTADLSALNPSQKLKNAKASCAEVEDNLTICKWSIELAPVTAGAKTIVINASDASGNKESASISKSLSLDDKGPVVKSLSTTTIKGTQVLAKPSGNTVTAVFDEATGLLNDEVILNAGGSKIKASSCAKDTQSQWACTWENIDFSSSSDMSIGTDTVDILSNHVAEIKSVAVTIDSKAPVLNNINISNVGGLIQAFPGLFKVGDKIVVLANLTEDNDVFAFADFSNFISGADKVAGSCERIQNDEHICTWQTDSINLQASNAITFNFSDNAGNTLIVAKPLKTFGLENASAPDFWKSEVSCSPKTIDRQLGPLINQRVYCQVSLKPKPNANKVSTGFNSTPKKISTVFISQAECIAAPSVLDSFETFNTEVGSESPIIRLTLKRDEFKIDNASVSCQLSIFSKVGSQSDITKNPEIENIKIPLGFFNLPLGELSEEVQGKINDAIDDANGIWKLIGTLNKLVFYAKKICSLINTLYNIVTTLFVVYALIKGAEFSCRSSIIANFFGICDATYAAATGECELTEGTSGTADGLKQTTNYFCDYVTCKKTFPWGDAVKNYMNNAPGIKYITKEASSKMDYEHNLIVATLFVCLPGMIYGLDKYRQILCLYADCLQNAVGKDGLPVTACEDQKHYATCKYITGEIFAVFPYTAVFDHYINLIKNALYNPFAVIGVAATLLCGTACPTPNDLGRAYHLCRGARLLNLVGDAAQNFRTMIDEGFKIRQDYCSRLDGINESTSTNSGVEVTTSQGNPDTLNSSNKK